MPKRRRRRAYSPPRNTPYAQFRTGLTFHEIYRMLFHRKRKSRHTVLGKWREIKLAMYAEHLAQEAEHLAQEAEDA